MSSTRRPGNHAGSRDGNTLWLIAPLAQKRPQPVQFSRRRLCASHSIYFNIKAPVWFSPKVKQVLIANFWRQRGPRVWWMGTPGEECEETKRCRRRQAEAVAEHVFVYAEQLPFSTAIGGSAWPRDRQVRSVSGLLRQDTSQKGTWRKPPRTRKSGSVYRWLSRRFPSRSCCARLRMKAMATPNARASTARKTAVNPPR